MADEGFAKTTVCRAGFCVVLFLALVAVVFIHASHVHAQVPAYQIALVTNVFTVVVTVIQAVSQNVGVGTSCWPNSHIHKKDS